MENTNIIVPYDKIDPQILNNLIDSFIQRHGTDYGEHEVSMKTKRKQIFSQIQTGEVLITYSTEDETINLIPKYDYI